VNDRETSEWFMLTPTGVLRAFLHAQPDEVGRVLQLLLAGERALDAQAWAERVQSSSLDISALVESGWVQRLTRPLQGPEARLDDFLQHVIASLSGERRAVLASDGGFCLGRTGVDPDEADALSAAAADYSEFSARQRRRGWAGASAFVSFHSDVEFLLPDWSFVPFWVDGAGYWLILAGEPLLNNPALVELLWGIKQAGSRFAVHAGF